MENSKKPLIIFGMRKMAELAKIYFSTDGEREVVGFCVDEDFRDHDEFLSLPVHSFDDIERHYPPSDFDMFVALGYSGLNKARSDKFFAAKKKGYTLASFISSSVTAVAGLEFGENCFVFDGTVFEPNCSLGDNVIIGGGGHFGHDVSVAAHCFIGAHVVCSGGVKIGERCFIGVNSTLRDRISVGAECIIGAGTILLGNARPNEVYVATASKKYPMNSEEFTRVMGI